MGSSICQSLKQTNNEPQFKANQYPIQEINYCNTPATQIKCNDTVKNLHKNLISQPEEVSSSGNSVSDLLQESRYRYQDYAEPETPNLVLQNEESQKCILGSKFMGESEQINPTCKLKNSMEINVLIEFKESISIASRPKLQKPKIDYQGMQLVEDNFDDYSDIDWNNLTIQFLSVKEQRLHQNFPHSRMIRKR